MIKTKKLLLIAGIIWTIAGLNVSVIGITTYPPYFNLLNILLSFATFYVFWTFIFNKLVIKHTKRICDYTEDKKYFWYCFDIKSFIIMVCMITFGISIRKFHIFPDSFIAFFYTGLGIALLSAGIKFIYTDFTIKEISL